MIFTSAHSRVNTLCTAILLLSICTLYNLVHQDPMKRLPPKLHKYMRDEDESIPQHKTDIPTLRRLLDSVNGNQTIFNLNKFGAVDDDTPILMIQVHKDFRRLQWLVLSLAQVRDVHSALLVFSHSYYQSRIDRLIQGIDFCRVVQIFYPHSLQLNPHKFPGIDRDDCLPNDKRVGQCAARDARLTEHKQHWWWKASFLFSSTACSSTHGAPVVFLDEHSLAAPDLLHMLRYTQSALHYFPQVEVISFGGPIPRSVETGLLFVEPWQPAFEVGLAFNRTTWKKIASLSAEFCMHDDTSWSYSLLNLFQSFANGHASMVACKTPRVLTSEAFANPKEMLNRVVETYDPKKLFPERVHTVIVFGREGVVEPAAPRPRERGGWSDLRDQVLCLDPLLQSAAEKRYDEYDAADADTLV